MYTIQMTIYTDRGPLLGEEMSFLLKKVRDELGHMGVDTLDGSHVLQNPTPTDQIISGAGGIDSKEGFGQL